MLAAQICVIYHFFSSELTASDSECNYSVFVLSFVIMLKVRDTRSILLHIRVEVSSLLQF